MVEPAWVRFDEIVAAADTSTPWHIGADGRRFATDVKLLEALLAVPLALGSASQSGLPAKAVDVWLAHELRRAGFGQDEVWPRARAPRILSREICLLLEGLPAKLRSELVARLESGKVAKAVSADATVLGKAYNKQVDVVIAQWARGPELLVSTKRMDSSIANNALNRIEESYGDAHNLRGRHPLAAIGYVLVLRASAMTHSPASAERLLDLVEKLGADPAGYDATAVIVAEWSSPAPGTAPVVEVLRDRVPPCLDIGAFLQSMVNAVLDRTPIDAHVHARELRAGRPLAVEEDQ